MGFKFASAGINQGIMEKSVTILFQARFSPYSDNGGSVVAIAGEDFVVIASDTRLSGQTPSTFF